ncbi:MAG: hemerythrin domain-containing protein [Phenylobacterium sp.]|uniref:hemerythrin domain-containing protein n=1 Tax=Phenylobacterium sp. TaxID=1871053 RepID=UPI00391B6617
MQDTDACALPHGRWDIYGPIHKGLRLASTELMIRLGRADGQDAAAVRSVLGDLREHLRIAAGHLDHEETFIHPLLAERQGAAAERLAEQHEDHRRGFGRLERMIQTVETAGSQERPARLRELYLAFSRFVADDLAHMHEEETITWPLLCALFTDEELAALEMRIIASIDPATNMAIMRRMIPAMTRQERAALLGGMQASAPPEVFRGVMEGAARTTLTAADFADLESRLSVAA